MSCTRLRQMQDVQFADKTQLAYLHCIQHAAKALQEQTRDAWLPGYSNFTCLGDAQEDASWVGCQVKIEAFMANSQNGAFARRCSEDWGRWGRAHQGPWAAHRGLADVLQQQALP